jgi:hypothetical protein
MQITSNLRQLHLQKNIIDSLEYNKQLEICKETINNSPNKLEAVINLESKILMPVAQIKQVYFRSKSNENSSREAQLLVEKLKGEKEERERRKRMREEIERKRRQRDRELEVHAKSMQEMEQKAKVLRKLEEMGVKREIEREKREKEYMEAQKRQHEIRSRTYLHQKMQRSMGK